MVHTTVRSLNSIFRNLKQSRGFSLIELLVVCGIIALISGLMLVSNSAFGGQVLLQNLSYDIALTLRQAQVYGISVQRFGTSNYGSAYGMHFDTSNPIVYPLFADAITVNGLYDPTPGVPLTDETVKTTTIGGGFRIYKLCVPAGADSTSCTSVTALDIIFKRPDPDACISINNIGQISVVNGSPVCNPVYTSARITVIAPRGNKSSVIVYQNGQISVQKNQ